jgi:hypothetical protein
MQNYRIELKWISTADMPADRLIKSLIKQKNEIFIKQLNLVNISDRLGSITAKDSKIVIVSLELAITEPANSEEMC